MVALVFLTVAIMLLYMMIGFGVCKINKSFIKTAKGLSGILIYALGPSMIINAFLKIDYSAQTSIRIAKYFVVTLILQAAFMGVIALFISRKYEDSKYRIMTAGAVLGNVGFIGMPLVKSIFPNEPIVLCYSSINVMSMNLIVFTIGVYLITNDKKYMSIKNAIINPTSIAMMIAIVLFAFNIHFPFPIEKGIELLAKGVTPLCMIILGIRLSSANLKDLFTRPFVYMTCLLKLVVFPIFVFILVKWTPYMDPVFKTSAIVLAMVPAGAIIQSLAELHECEQEFAANVVLLTTILSVVTIPIMTFILV